MRPMVQSYQPLRPYLLFHPKFIRTYGNKTWQYQMYRNVYDLGWWRQGCFAIDVNCQRFPLRDVIDHGLAWTVWNLPIPGFQGSGGKILNVEYVFGEPAQMTFDEMRDLFVEQVAAMRKTGQNGETQAQFRARNAAYTDVTEFINSVGLMGNWPAPKKSLR
jgi:hypothetical protein